MEEFGNVSPPQMKPVNIHDILDRARKSAAPGYAAHMTIREAYDPSLPPTLGDADQLLQVLLNLIKNAAEASKGQPGEIKLRTYYEQYLRLRRPDGTGRGLPLQIEIIDDGPGYHRKSPLTFSTPSCRAVKTAPASGSRSFLKSFLTMTAGSTWKACPARRSFAYLSLSPQKRSNNPWTAPFSLQTTTARSARS